MKSKIFKLLSFILIFVLIIPINVKAETLTYGNILDELAKAKKELEKNNQSLGNTQGQIQKDNEKIRTLKKEIENMKEENTKIQQEIAQASIDIEDKKKQTKDIIVYLQMSQGENIYLEYVFGSDSITDMVYRLSIVEQITEYNDQMIKELEELIRKNESRKIELAEKEKQTEQKIEELNSEIAKLNKTVSNLNSLAPSLKAEVEAKEASVAYYKSQGCSNRSDRIGIDCAKTSANAYFSKPITNGYVTSFTGYRRICLKDKYGNTKCEWKFHKGIDIGSKTGKNTPIYSIGNGVIKSIWHDDATRYGYATDAKCVNIEYKLTNGVYYTAIYCHLDRYANIWEGMEVTPNTLLGYMGATGMVTGVHLHLEVYPCRLYLDKQCISWSAYENFTKSKFDSGTYKGSESVINFPSRVYETWYSR